MSTLPFLDSLRVPPVCAPLFLVSAPDLVVAACRAGVVGPFTVLDARTSEHFESSMADITRRLDDARAAESDADIAPLSSSASTVPLW